METLEKGKAYVFLALPLWFRGVLEKETPFFFILTADSAEYLPDADRMAAYLSKKTTGEKIGRRVFVPRDGTFILQVEE